MTVKCSVKKKKKSIVTKTRFKAKISSTFMSLELIPHLVLSRFIFLSSYIANFDHFCCDTKFTHMHQLHKKKKKCATSCCKSVILAFSLPKHLSFSCVPILSFIALNKNAGFKVLYILYQNALLAYYCKKYFFDHFLRIDHSLIQKFSKNLS